MLKEHNPAPSLLSRARPPARRSSAGLPWPVCGQSALALGSCERVPKKGEADLRAYLMVSVAMFLLPQRLVVLKAAI
jgi:hypothetical protein